MVRTITTKFDGFCADCSAPIPAGTRARWTGRGRVFGLTCHARSAPSKAVREQIAADNAWDAPGSAARDARWAREEAFAFNWGLDD